MEMTSSRPNTFLVWAGVGLSLTHALTAWSWYFDGFYVHYSASSMLGICHAFWLNCLQITIPQNVMILVLGVYGLLSLMTAAFFFLKSRNAAPLLWLLTLSKIFFFALRFNVMGNYHLLHFFMSFIFLCLPQKRFSLYLGIIYLYFLAGMLKLNPEWLSGAALVSKPLLTGKWLSLALCYVVVMELIVTWGLLSNQRWLRTLTLLQLTLFHAFSWHIVGYYYPVTMFLLLLPFYADLFSKSQDHLRWSHLKFVTVAFFSISFAFQIYPFINNRDPALTGRFRSLRINMLDSRPTCSAMAFLEKENTIYSLNIVAANSYRTRCDTSVFETQLRRYCQQRPADSHIRYILYSKRELDEKYKVIEDTHNVCRRYSAQDI